MVHQRRGDDDAGEKAVEKYENELNGDRAKDLKLRAILLLKTVQEQCKGDYLCVRNVRRMTSDSIRSHMSKLRARIDGMNQQEQHEKMEQVNAQRLKQAQDGNPAAVGNKKPGQ
jgi:hypothetical protein